MSTRGFCRSCEKKKKIKYLDLSREQKETWDMKVIVIPIVNGAFGTGHKDLGNSLGELERENRNRRKHNAVKISKDTEKTPVDPSCFVILKNSIRNERSKTVVKKRTTNEQGVK